MKELYRRLKIYAFFAAVKVITAVTAYIQKRKAFPQSD